MSDPADAFPWDSDAIVGGARVGDYVPYVMGHLNLLQATPTGANFFPALTLLGKRIIIVFAGANGVACRGPGPAANKLFVQAKVNAESARMGQELDQALRQSRDQDWFGDEVRDVDWFCDQLLHTPLHRWDPANTVQHSPLNPSGFATGSMQFLDLKKGLRGCVEDWRRGRGSLSQEHDVIDLMLLILRHHFTNGPGGGSRINYDPLKTGMGAGLRPPQIGLFHELVHAYYNAQGSQLSVEDSASENVGRYYELMAVGLPPFAAEPYTENAMRAHFPPTLPRNRY